MTDRSQAFPSPAVLRAPAPAKVNLGLRVAARRPDGRHELESVFVPLDLRDEVSIEVSAAAEPAVALEVGGEDAGVPAGATNLAARAAAAFLDAVDRRLALRIRLTKRIPAAAGLGGGSSDAGAVLRALAAHLPDALAPGALAALALGLGADVPFFLDPRPAWVGGVGERVEPLPGVPALALLLANPGMPLSTAGVYRAFDALHPTLTPRRGPSTLRPLLGLWTEAASRSAALAGLLENDLEPAAIRLCPPVARLRDRLRAAGALAVGMSGSGPTVFGIFRNLAEAESALAGMSCQPPIWARVATTVESG